VDGRPRAIESRSPAPRSRTLGEQSCRHSEGSARTAGDAIMVLTCGDKTTMDAGRCQEMVLSALENR
jgi:hypothetical protein